MSLAISPECTSQPLVDSNNPRLKHTLDSRHGIRMMVGATCGSTTASLDLRDVSGVDSLWLSVQHFNKIMTSN